MDENVKNEVQQAISEVSETIKDLAKRIRRRQRTSTTLNDNLYKLTNSLARLVEKANEFSPSPGGGKMSAEESRTRFGNFDRYDAIPDEMNEGDKLPEKPRALFSTAPDEGNS